MRFTARRFGAPAAPAEGAVVERYALSMRWMHWTMGSVILGGIGSVLYAQSLPEEERDYMKPSARYSQAMWYHKSCGMTVAILVPFRVGMMLVQKRPGMVPGSDRVTHAAATTTHYVLYGLFTWMAATGVGMQYASGNNMPFWFTEFETGPYYKDSAKADWNYNWHALVGKYGKFLIPVHVGGALVHQARGHAIFTRMNPFA